MKARALKLHRMFACSRPSIGSSELNLLIRLSALRLDSAF